MQIIARMHMLLNVIIVHNAHKYIIAFVLSKNVRHGLGYFCHTYNLLGGLSYIVLFYLTPSIRRVVSSKPSSIT